MSGLSGMMRQYLEIKEQNKDSILFYRVGDFYEMFFDDAIVASKELEIALTGKDCGLEERAPMCGVPFHSAEPYIGKLISKGYKVSVCEQTENPATSKGLVKREVVRIITPGTINDSNFLPDSRNNFICGIYKFKDDIGLCFTDMTTGEIFLSAVKHENEAINEIGKYNPCETVVSGKVIELSALMSFLNDRLRCLVSVLDDADFEFDYCDSVIKKHFNNDVSRVPDAVENRIAYITLGGLLSYLYKTQMTNLSYIDNITFYQQNAFLELDNSARRNLELTETMMRNDKRGSLLWVLDKTKTPMGSRLIKNWMLQPLVNCALISKRQNAVDCLYNDGVKRQELIEALSGINDIERLMGKVVFGNANAKDLLAIGATLARVPKIKHLLSDVSSVFLKEVYNNLDVLADITRLINDAINPDAPVSIREGKIIRKGYNEELEELREIVADATKVVARLEAKEKEETGIKNLKIRFNKVFGYYIEVSKANTLPVPDKYIRKQTVLNAERYFTEELKELEVKLLGAEEKAIILEGKLFADVMKIVADALHRIQMTSRAIAAVDVIASLAEVAARNNYTMPIVDCGNLIHIKEGRHPVVEKVLKDEFFVPNDTLLDTENVAIQIITGPNMAGKSTYMRQVALIVLMAQIGSFVPAKSAKIGIVDKIFTRVGASDDLSTGRSTFMVEMNEVSNILKHATQKSLIILDEVGRGTSTFDGMSIARSVLEYTANKKKLGAKTLFATHYHEITDIVNDFNNIKNYNITVKKRGEDVIFLRKIVEGAADDSFGIDVARLAGIPDSVVKRAREILKTLEDKNYRRVIENDEFIQDVQISMTDTIDTQLYNKIKSVNIDVMTPIDAMNLLYELKKLIERE